MDANHDFRDIPIDDLLEPEDQVRTVIVFEGLQDLAESIKIKGVIQPLIVLKKGDKYEITDGHRRYLASKMAGLLSVPCIIRAPDVKDADFIKLHANYFREDVNPVDEGKFFIKLHDKHGLAYNEISKLCSRSDTYVINRVQLLQGDESVLAALEAGQLNFSQACEISRASDKGIRLELLRITVESGATVETLRGMRYDYERRVFNRGPDSAPEICEPGHYPEVKHLIKCPVCLGAYPVNQLYPISTCKTCYDNFMKALEGGKG